MSGVGLSLTARLVPCKHFRVHFQRLQDLHETFPEAESKLSSHNLVPSLPRLASVTY